MHHDHHSFPRQNKFFDFIFTILSCWMMLGLYIDGWAHNHLGDSLESFFTPWHAIFYSGFFVTALSLFVIASKNYKKGFGSFRLLPREYYLSTIGALIFFFGGFVDMLWHTLIGIEVSVEALLSPPHLLLAVGGSLLISGPFRSLWHRTSARNMSQTISVVLSLALLLSFFTFMTQFIHPTVHPFMSVSEYSPNVFTAQSLGVAGYLVQTAIFMGLIALALRRWKFPIFSFTLILTFNTILLSFMHDHFYLIVAAFCAGIILDVIYALTRDAIASSTHALRIFCFFVPVVLWGMHAVIIQLTEGIWWSVPLWSGILALTGITGYLITYLVAPAKVAQEHHKASEIIFKL